MTLKFGDHFAVRVENQMLVSLWLYVRITAFIINGLHWHIVEFLSVKVIMRTEDLFHFLTLVLNTISLELRTAVCHFLVLGMIVHVLKFDDDILVV